MIKVMNGSLYWLRLKQQPRLPITMLLQCTVQVGFWSEATNYNHYFRVYKLTSFISF